MSDPNPLALEIIDELTGLSYPYETLNLKAQLKLEDKDFRVAEELAYEPTGEGEHIFIYFERSGWCTKRIAGKISQVLGLDKRQTGYAGQKDRHAVVFQTLSFQSANLDDTDIRQKMAEHCPEIKILNISRHQHKLKIGHVKANHFKIRLRNIEGEDALEKCQARAQEIMDNGFANYYGPQRFGLDYNNVHDGFALLKGFKRVKVADKRSFLCSALQSALFNIYLSQRIQNDFFKQIIQGDVLKKCDTGGLFADEDTASNQVRLEAGEIVYTGPMFGAKMVQSTDMAQTFESQILEHYHLGYNKFRKLKSNGTRRPAIIYPEQIDISPIDDDLLFKFELPSGSYATTLLSHFFELVDVGQESKSEDNQIEEKHQKEITEEESNEKV